MPLLTLPDPILMETQKKQESKKMKNNNETLEIDSPISEKESKTKKTKESKKHKVLQMENEEEERSGTSSELVELVNSKLLKSVTKDSEKKNKKAKVDEEEEVKSKKDPNTVSRFRISVQLRSKLKVKGIESLFPIQAMTFDTILDNSDLVSRAHIGRGETLAFVLPILESLTNGPAKALRKTGYGRAPSVVVISPTRELAKQAFADFDTYGGTLGLTSCCLYGEFRTKIKR